MEIPNTSTPLKTETITTILKESDRRHHKPAILADDTTTAQSSQSLEPLSSQASQPKMTFPKPPMSARSKSRRAHLEKRRAVQVTESAIFKWAEEERKVNPGHLTEVGQKLLDMVQATSSKSFLQSSDVEQIDWKKVAEDTKETPPHSSAAPPQTDTCIRRTNRYSRFNKSQPKKKAMSILKVVHDDNELTPKQDLSEPSESFPLDPIQKSSLQPDAPKFGDTSIPGHESVLQPETHTEDIGSPLCLEESSPFFTSEIDSDIGRELSQDLNSIRVPISVPLKTKYHPPSLAPEPVEQPGEILPTIPSPKASIPVPVATAITNADIKPTVSAPSGHDDDSIVMPVNLSKQRPTTPKTNPRKMMGKPRANPLLIRLQQRQSENKNPSDKSDK